MHRKFRCTAVHFARFGAPFRNSNFRFDLVQNLVSRVNHKMAAKRSMIWDYLGLKLTRTILWPCLSSYVTVTQESLLFDQPSSVLYKIQSATLRLIAFQYLRVPIQVKCSKRENTRSVLGILLEQQYGQYIQWKSNANACRINVRVQIITNEFQNKNRTQSYFDTLTILAWKQSCMMTWSTEYILTLVYRFPPYYVV